MTFFLTTKSSWNSVQSLDLRSAQEGKVRQTGIGSLLEQGICKGLFGIFAQEWPNWNLTPKNLKDAAAELNWKPERHSLVHYLYEGTRVNHLLDVGTVLNTLNWASYSKSIKSQMIPFWLTKIE